MTTSSTAFDGLLGTSLPDGSSSASSVAGAVEPFFEVDSVRFIFANSTPANACVRVRGFSPPSTCFLNLTVFGFESRIETWYAPVVPSRPPMRIVHRPERGIG